MAQDENTIMFWAELSDRDESTEPESSGLYPIFRHSRIVNNTIVKLAKYFDRTELKRIEGECDWICEFKTDDQSRPESGFTGARTAFLKNGSECIRILEQFQEAQEYGERNDHLMKHGEALEYLQYLYLFQKRTELPPSTSVTLKDDTGPMERALSLQDVEDSEKKRLFYTAASEAKGRRGTSSLGSPFERSWHAFVRVIPCNTENIFPGRTGADGSHQKHVRWLAAIQNCLDASGLVEDSVRIFNSQLKAFTYHIGCPKAYDEPQMNLAELRLFNATRMPFFQKLQDDLQAQIALNKKQQEIITALVFRHLAEHLPPRTRANVNLPRYDSRQSTENWQNFWKEAIIEEKNGYSKSPGEVHPLTNLQNMFSGSRGVVVTPPAPGSSVPGSPTITDESKKGMKGNGYRAGDELYADLSTNIHQYRLLGPDIYEVADDQWGERTRSVLRALKPRMVDGKPDWDEEYKRYIRP